MQKTLDTPYSTMFGLFSKKQNNECPIDPEMRLWMENAFLWLAGQFGKHNIATKQMLLPTPECFPIRYDGSKQSLLKTAEIVAGQMEINIQEISLDFDKNNEGKYDILVEKKNLNDPENLVATLAHEFSHIKLLGEK